MQPATHRALPHLLAALFFSALSLQAFSLSTPAAAPIVWRDASQWLPAGRAWDDTPTPFARLPRRAETTVPKAVWRLSQNSAGLVYYFRTNATEIRTRHEVASEIGAMPHMTAVAASGLDLYARDPNGSWRWAGATKPTPKTKRTEQPILTGATPEMRDYMLYLPLYNSTLSLEIGVPENATFEPLPPPPQKPIAYYGTSIVQGCSASRPGMAVPAQLARKLDTPVINLGFSGAGLMEPALAALLAEIDASIFILDCIPNMNSLPPEEIASRVENCVRVIRQKHPATPIVLVEGRTHANAWLVPANREKNETAQAVLRATHEKLVAAGVPALTYVPDARLLGDDDEATVDGSHPTDLGLRRQTDRLLPLLKPLLPK